MKKITLLLLTSMTSLFIWGCSPDMPTGSGAGDSFPGELSKSEYDALTNEQKYQVADKLTGTMFKGVPVSEFFDLSNGLSSAPLKSGQNFLANMKAELNTELTNSDRQTYDVIIDGFTAKTGNPSDNIDSKYSFSDARPKELAFARMYEYPISKDFFDHWIAYILTNTILFSPAEEIDSASIRDVQKVYLKLVADLQQNNTVRQIVSRHMRTQENWRRFRSPEDNTREMIEIYLGLFDRDADVPRASKACQDLYLTDNEQHYELESTGFINTEPQYVLDTFVTTCSDFYDVVAGHPLLIPRVTTVIVEYLFPTKTGEERANIISTVLSGGPQTFQDIFKSILFSKAYLLDNERPKSIEENFLSVANRVKWQPYSNVFKDMASESSTNQLSLKQMGWDIMSRKLGRFTGVPTDAYSFAFYSRALHSKMMLDSNGWGKGAGVVERTNGIPNEANDVPPDPGEPPVAPAGDAGQTAWDAYSVATDDYKARLEAYQIKKRVFDKAEADYQKEAEHFSEVKQLSVPDFIDYAFMTGDARKATDEEKTAIYNYFASKNYIATSSSGVETIKQSYLYYAMRFIFDYQAMLTEQYYFKAIK